jgi:hypothetical protein
LARAGGVFVVVMGGLLAFSRFVVSVISVIVVVIISIFIIVVVAFVISRASVAGLASCAPGWEWSPC